VQRDLKRTFALGDRYPVAEQQINAALAGDPDGFFKNRYGLAAELKELMRYTLNEMEFKTALLENRAPNIRLRVPSGRINDPMIFENKHTMAYLNDRKAAGSNPVGTKILMSRTTAEARNKELPEDQKIPIPKGADGVILTVEEDKNNPGNYIFEPAPLEQQEQWRAEQQKMQELNQTGERPNYETNQNAGGTYNRPNEQFSQDVDTEEAATGGIRLILESLIPGYRFIGGGAQ
jgi:hypothetical protein